MTTGNFKIELITTNVYFNTKKQSYEKSRHYTPLTFYKDGKGTVFGTYDENLVTKNNSQYSLTFSIAKYYNNQTNPLFHMIVENRRLRLTTTDKIIDFVITGITPNVTQKNTIYNVTCQDAFSYDFSKQNILISYEDYSLAIDTHAKQLLKIAKMDELYMIDNTLEKRDITNFPNLLTTSLVEWADPTLTSMELTDTTPYAAFVQLAEQYGAIIDITYPTSINSKAIIHFRNQALIPYKGYSVRPDVNLTNFSVSRKTDNYCSILRVSGGEDADGNLISLMPDMPVQLQDYLMETLGSDKDWTSKSSPEIQSAFKGSGYYTTAIADSTTKFFIALNNIVKSGGNFLYNFDHFKESGLLDQAGYDSLERLMSVDMRNANLLQACYSHALNAINSDLAILLYEEEELVSMIAAENDNIYQLLQSDTITDTIRTSLKESINGIRDSRGYTTKDLTVDSTTTYKGLRKLWFKNNYKYIQNYFRLSGGITISNGSQEVPGLQDRITKLKQQLIQAESEYKQYKNKKDALLQANNNTEESMPQASFDEYCWCLDQMKKLSRKINVTIQSKDAIPLFDDATDEYGSIVFPWTKKGYYQVYIDELTKLQDFIINNSEILPAAPGTPITILLEKQTTKANTLWKTLYATFGDFICEATFSDENQLNNDGLYLTAQKYFASYCRPTVDYSTTIINMDKIVCANKTNIELGDIIHLYNKELYSVYNGNLIIEIPYMPFIVGQVEIQHYDNLISTTLLVSKVEHKNNSTTLLYLQESDLSKANIIMLHPCKLVIANEEQMILSKQLDTIAKPIELQVTGITTKLRESTTQLTVSTNRIVNNLLGKLLRQVK